MRAMLLGVLLVPAAGCTSLLELQVRGVKTGHDMERKEVPPPSLRIYLLKDDDRFNEASVDKLWTDQQNALGEDLLKAQEYQTVFGAATDEPKKVPLGKDSDEIRCIAILALLPKEHPMGPRKLVLTKSDLSRVLRVTWTHIELEK